MTRWTAKRPEELEAEKTRRGRWADWFAWRRVLVKTDGSKERWNRWAWLEVVQRRRRHVVGILGTSWWVSEYRTIPREPRTRKC